jgi:hypothetical protein
METFTAYLTIANMIYVAVSVLSLAIIFVLHVKSKGRTSGFAVVAFIIFGPVLGVVINSWDKMREAGLQKSFEQISETLMNGTDLTLLGLRAVCIGLAAGAIAAIGTAIISRGE